MKFCFAKEQKGTSLLDVVFGTALLLIVFVGLYGAFQLTLELVQSSKSKTGALALAQERVEFIRSLDYDDIGTVGGIPQGTLVEEEEETLNNITYTRRTFIQYVDAPQDGMGGSDTNGITADYKTVRVNMEWLFREETRTFSLVTSIVPQGIESVVGGGILYITALSSLGSPVPSAQINIINNTLTPAVSLSTFTNTNGVAQFLGAPAASNYEVTVSKTNYSSAGTYSVEGENTNPSPGHLTVAEDQTTSSGFAIDVLGSATVRTFEVGTTTPILNITFSIRGDKTVGTDSENDSIYKYSSMFSTGSSGSVVVSNLEWDNYAITINDGVVGYDIAEICTPQPFSLSPGESETVDIYLAANTTHSLLVDVKDSGGNVQSGASVRLYRSGYDTTTPTGTCGQSFFNNSLSSGTYSLYVSLSGYAPTTVNNIEVSGSSVLSVVLNSI
jgi:hypothetical protein